MDESTTTTAGIAVVYVAANNPDGLYFDGVPLRDLTQIEFDALPEHYRRGILESPFYKAPEA